ncbi:SpaH/EbpB family LPXTG-anchored major pilin [Jeotgalibaca dankookensis]|uniref:SpaH/EbpB family LPXTG-anchored major pilin n=1 Tax=Jeotgalibaca dankookensis TaxID=708126 RepID=UPI000781EAAD|nr:SpaH/EbpB family LPXTG-anchored major pilin [Jeotgalibaca dankookensis]
MNKLFKWIATIFLAMLMFAGATRPILTSAVSGDDNDSQPPTTEVTGRPATGDLIIHKLQFNVDEIPNIENHNGEELTITGTSGLAGVTFNIYRVADDATDTTTPAGAALNTGVTGAGGLLEFSDLTAGRYLVVEDISNLPFGVTYTSPNFLVDVPMTKADGTGWLGEVHVYPKNRLIVATVDFYKFFEDKGKNPNKTATFKLYKGTSPSGTLIEEKIVNTNDATGRIYFDNAGKGLDVGNYYIVETAVDAPYGLNDKVITFEVTNGDHDADLQDGEATIHALGDKKFNNYLLTEPNKENTDDDNDDFSANLGEIVNWNIDVRIPTNISDYTEFQFTDDLDSRLDYVGNLIATVDDTDVVFTATEPATTGGGTLVVVFTKENLANYAGKMLKISFNTKINETAEMGEKIPNNFVFEFDNGSGTQTKTDPTPPYTQTGGAKFDKTSSDSTLEDFSGAEFWIYRGSGAAKQYLQTNYTWGDGTANPMVLVSDTNGNFEIEGLSFGNYSLEERVALPGHMLRSDFDFVVSAESYKVNNPHEILNKTQIKLPETGGMGTIAFTIAGIGLMAGAVKLYRKEEKE